MKKVFLVGSILSIGLFSFATGDKPEKAGDNLDLEGVLDLFEKSKSVEDFENQLNSEKNEVNNLDLNEDGFVDYIRVIDYADGNTHSLTLQVPYSNDEAQDVAVIYLEDNGDKSTVIQIVGDEDLYGANVIVEPGSDDNDEVTDVRDWAVVRHMYSPGYVIWISPWRFGYYPAWYYPWKPMPWPDFYARPRPYHPHYRHVVVYRCPAARTHYTDHRVYSHTYQAHHPAPQPKTSAPAGGGTAPKGKPVVTGNKKVTVNANPNPAPSSPAPSEQKKVSSPGSVSAPAKNQSPQGKPTKRPGGNTGTPQSPNKNPGGKSGGGKKGGR